MIICDLFLEKLLSCFPSRLLWTLHLGQEESDAWDLRSPWTSACKLCSMVINFWFQLVFRATC